MVFNPDYLTAEQKQKSLGAVNLIKLKSNGKFKGRMCANGSPQQFFLSMEEAKLTEITLEGLVVDSYDDREVSTFDVPGAYIQTDLPKDKFFDIITVGQVCGYFV